MTVAVVILNFNGVAHLSRFLPTVLKNSQPHKVIVADNGSTDESVQWLTANHPEVALISIPENLGYSGGYNYAIQQVEEELLVLLNTDVEVTPHWIDPVVGQFESDSTLAACQPKILAYHSKTHFEYAGAGGGYIDQFGFPFCRGRIFDTTEEDTGQYDDNIEVFWASGACMFVNRLAFVELGGFDEDFFAHMEEIDLCWRMQNAGYTIGYCGESTVYHVGGGTLSKANPFKTYLNFRNGLNMLVKNEAAGRLWWKLPVRAGFDMVALIKFALFDSWKDGWAIVRAHAYFWSHLGKNLQKRKMLKKTWNGTPSPSHIFHGSIVINYYLKRVRKFSQLRF